MKSAWKKTVDFFFFPAKERMAVLLVVMVVIVLFLLPFFIKRQATAPTVEELAGTTPQEKALFAQAAEQASGSAPFAANYASNQAAGNKALKPHRFDPNTVTEHELVQMGLAPKVAATWAKFRSRGGQFRHPDDIRKLYTLPPEQADALLPFAFVAGAQSQSRPFAYDRSENPSTRGGKTYQPIDINTATQADWEQLPMVGEYTAKQILKYRASLPNGFHSIEQVGNTYNLRTENFEVFRPYLRFNGSGPAAPKASGSKASGKIDLNTASRADLLKCAYISNDIAEAILVQRRNRGPFASTDELSRIVFLKPDQIAQIKTCVEVVAP